MDGFRSLIKKYPAWIMLETYISNIEKNTNIDFSIVIENLKALLESIAKQICKQHDVKIEPTISLNKLVKKTVDCLNFDKNKEFEQISSALATIAEKLGNLRNQKGVQVHGKELLEIEVRNLGIADFEKDYLINITLENAKYLIQLYQQSLGQLSYEDSFDYNNYLDGLYGDILIIGKRYKASHILYTLDNDVYKKNNLSFFIKYLITPIQQQISKNQFMVQAFNKIFPKPNINQREFYRNKLYRNSINQKD